jgi:two-component system, OmpR family, sensor kinase
VKTIDGRTRAEEALAQLREMACRAECSPAENSEQMGAALRSIADQLEPAFQRATATEDALRRFVADASHEMRIPLTVIRGEAELLLRRDGGDDPERCAALATIDEEANRLGRLLDDLLTLDYHPGRLRLHLEPIDLPAFLTEFVERYADAWPQRTMIFRNDVPPGTTATADRDALTRVMINLVDNAARYSTTDGAITLAARRAGGQAVITVSDEGPGMSAEESQRVFERFYRGAAGRAHERRGSGLGLSIVRALIEAAGGTVELTTAPDLGTTVTVTLPIARA